MGDYYVNLYVNNNTLVSCVALLQTVIHMCVTLFKILLVTYVSQRIRWLISSGKQASFLPASSSASQNSAFCGDFYTIFKSFFGRKPNRISSVRITIESPLSKVVIWQIRRDKSETFIGSHILSLNRYQNQWPWLTLIWAVVTLYFTSTIRQHLEPTAWNSL